MKQVVCTLLLLLWAVLSSQAQTATLRLAHGGVLTLQRAPFAAAGKTSGTYHASYQDLDAVNGRPVFGTDGELPQYILRKATLLLNGVRYELKVTDMYNPWFGAGLRYQPNPDSFRLQKTGIAYRLQALLSDGAGTYMAEWKIVGKAATRTMLTEDEDQIVTTFYKQ